MACRWYEPNEVGERASRLVVLAREDRSLDAAGLSSSFAPPDHRSGPTRHRARVAPAGGDGAANPRAR